MSVIGGFLDIYTYLYRGKVFANAVTGNMVLFGFHLAERNWTGSARYLLAILSYALGVFLAEVIHGGCQRTEDLLESDGDSSGNALSSSGLLHPLRGTGLHCELSDLLCLRASGADLPEVHGLPFASTMCTGNLRSGTEALFHSWKHRGTGDLAKAMHYYGIILCFIFGAAAGAVLLHWAGHLIFLLIPLGLLTVFLLITPRRQLVGWRRRLRALRGK